MNYKLLLSSLLVMLSINYTTQIFFVLYPFESRCISKEMPEKSLFSGVFFISGEEETANTAFILDGNSKVIWKAESQKHADFNIEIAQAGVYSLCMEATSDQMLTVSFDLYDEKKNEQIISIHNIQNLNTVVHSIRRKLDIIHSNMRNSAIRRGIHLEVSKQINSKITFYTAIKIFFLVLFSIFQIMMLTSIFSNVKVVSSISVNESKSYHKVNPSDTTGEIIL